MRPTNVRDRTDVPKHPRLDWPSVRGILVERKAQRPPTGAKARPPGESYRTAVIGDRWGTLPRWAGALEVFRGSTARPAANRRCGLLPDLVSCAGVTRRPDTRQKSRLPAVYARPLRGRLLSTRCPPKRRAEWEVLQCWVATLPKTLPIIIPIIGL